MSHEIRTPIHGILGLAELLSGGRLDSQQSKYVDAIARSGELLSSVVSDILDYSKVEAGKPMPSMEPQRSLTMERNSASLP